MKLLFLSRAYPPIIGGLENHNYELHSALQKKNHVDSIINKKGKKALPFFMPFCSLKALYSSSKYDAVLLGDGVLASVGWLIKLFQPSVPVICTIHGLDLTYSSRIYQYFWIKKFLPRMDKIIAVSRATKDAAIERGIKKSKLEVIPNGINPWHKTSQHNQKQLEKLLHTSCQEKTILLTIGRLVKRKGVHWFISHVMPNLNDQYIYIIAGDGSEKERINLAIREFCLEKRVFCLGFVCDHTKAILYSNSDLFIQPNIKVSGDMEGFGIAVLEANLHGLPVLGSKLEGLEDSIIEEKNGWLVAPEKPSSFIKKIEEVTQSRQKLNQAGHDAKVFCLEHFSWDKIADQYIEILLNTKAESNEH
jgi:glycosyltransferase involved in cell wall biosynthesis